MAGKEVTIKKVYEAVRLGEKRLQNFRAARLMFIKQYAGPYYDKPKAEIGSMPISLIYNAISILVPNLVTNFPKTLVKSEFMNYRGVRCGDRSLVPDGPPQVREVPRIRGSS